MTKNQEVIVASVAAGVAVIVAHRIITNITYRKHIKQIQVKTNDEIARMKIAAEKVQQMIGEGKYDKTGITQIFEDFEFERIVADTDK